MTHNFWILALFLLSACGFQPVYSTHTEGTTSVQQEFAQIYIPSLPNKAGIDLKNMLIDRLKPASSNENAAYTLDITLQDEKLTQTIISDDASATRVRLEIPVRYILTDARTGNVLLENKTIGFGSYNVVSSQYATLVTKENTRQNALQQIADNITSRLSLYFSN